MKTVLLLTEAYPLGGITEEAFVKPEIEALASVFDRVVVVPVMERGPLSSGLPDNVIVSRDVVDSKVWRHKWLRPLRHPMSILSGSGDVRYSLAAGVVECALKAIAGRLALSPHDTVMEAFWFDFASTALCRLNRKYGYKYCIRAHRYDIYTERAKKHRKEAIEMSAGLFSVSNSGAEFLRSRFPMTADKIFTAYLGVPNAPAESKHSDLGEKKVRLLTVARISDVKRCDLCFDFTNALATARPQWNIEWTLIGDGPEAESLRIRMSNHRENLTVNLIGAMTHEEVMNYYSSATIDWLIMLSSSEGLSIAALEAMAHGVPVIATDVGGTAEAVDDSTGLLLPPDPEREEFVRGLMPFLDSRMRYDALCAGARNRVAEFFDARKLRKEWAWKLIELIE